MTTGTLWGRSPGDQVTYRGLTWVVVGVAVVKGDEYTWLQCEKYPEYWMLSDSGTILHNGVLQGSGVRAKLTPTIQGEPVVVASTRCIVGRLDNTSGVYLIDRPDGTPTKATVLGDCYWTWHPDHRAYVSTISPDEPYIFRSSAETTQTTPTPTPTPTPTNLILDKLRAAPHRVTLTRPARGLEASSRVAQLEVADPLGAPIFRAQIWADSGRTLLDSWETGDPREVNAYIGGLIELQYSCT